MGEIRISISASVREALEEQGQRTGRPVEEVARELIERGLLLQRLRRLRGELRPYAQRAGRHTDEDVFRTIS